MQPPFAYVPAGHWLHGSQMLSVVDPSHPPTRYVRPFLHGVQAASKRNRKLRGGGMDKSEFGGGSKEKGKWRQT